MSLTTPKKEHSREFLECSPLSVDRMPAGELRLFYPNSLRPFILLVQCTARRRLRANPALHSADMHKTISLALCTEPTLVYNAHINKKAPDSLPVSPSACPVNELS